MHSKNKGNIGELVTAARLSRLGYNVFLEAGDNSKIDLIAETNGKLIRFQCKSVTPGHSGQLSVYTYKHGPNYRFTYNESMFDYFAVYDLTTEELFFIPVGIVLANKRVLTLNKTNKHLYRNIDSSILP
jgi:hypothetical protein